MLRTQIAAAIGCARANALDEIMREIWTRHGAGQLSDDEAGELSTLAHERRAALRGSGQGAFSLVMPPPPARCPTPVRRDSHFKGRSEVRIWRPTNRQEVQKVLLAAKRYELAERQKGERAGPLGSVAIEVLEFFVNLVDFRTGRLEPSIDTIMGKVRRSRDAVVRALKALRAHGFLDWLRRYEPTGREGSGPQVQQASNAYRLSLPERALRLLGRFGKAPPPPDDHVAAQTARAAELDAYRKALPLDELALFEAGDTALGRALAALGKSLQERESAKQTESPSQSIIAMQT
ncbi:MULTISPECIES: helix-turn-helix domain-containing protein [unclassified Chelatococcus]|uniref:helix-turn-helix domain-containing protein n=1 Tax=unclassified Chelatococcus TaxID=2638111 RepID=UPI001BCE8D5F|nr:MULTISPECIES: helix-turn-helix domain-containing protein [unclassified Chelatococcus]MBS7701624.1 helix-turn-helix domain-containing protein [Chelatococcus sp. YT9]MBX3559694.1 helix-turn-helix domain-containing protein [Chelatococcus sp.]